MNDEVFDYNLLAATEGRPLNFRVMRPASAHARLIGPCGDTAQFWLKIDDHIIRKASFVSDGCESLVLCCSAAAHLVEGLLLADAAALLPDQILARAPPIPVNHRGCAVLACNTLKAAIADYHGVSKKSPLKQRINWRGKSKRGVP